MVYRSCKGLEENNLFFHGDLDRGSNVINYCCTSDEAGLIGIDVCEDPELTIMNYMARKKEIIGESMKIAATGRPSSPENKYHAVCARCPIFHEDDWPCGEDDLIRYILFGLKPSPCQSRCIYCSQRLEKRRKFDNAVDAAAYDLVFKTIEYATQAGLVADDVLWEFGSGEITVHPFRDRLYDIVGNSAASWLTNCFIFDKRIAANMKRNPASSMMLSLDAGTPETWLKIKGRDNFDAVTDNLVKYYAEVSHSGQIILKYLLMPGINDNIEDFVSFVEIAKVLESPLVVLSKDRWAQTTEGHLESASILVALLVEKLIRVVFSLYSKPERSKIITSAEALIAGK